MLIPSIDLMGGRIVQLEQGERLRVETDDFEGWISRLRAFPLVQVIDLDAARREGSNRALVEGLCRTLPCRVGGGVRTPSDARGLADAGARSVIVGSALFDQGRPDPDRARPFADAIGVDAVVAAVDSRGGRVVTHGWRTTASATPIDAMRALEDGVGGFLYTHVDREGLLGGVDLALARTLAGATSRRLTVAGGIRSIDEVAALHRCGADAVVGMAIYTGLIDLDEAARRAWA
jgi:phosphoribosylformimino-5-aminoimidazole carboxamide ribotide isomerase